MKIIHTADWHLGHVLYNYDRHEEQQSMLEQMVEIVEAEQPDVFILAGDVFDNAQPSAAIQTMLSDALVKMHRANPDMAIVSIAGNHDSGSRHTIFHSAWKILNVIVLGNVYREETDFSKYVVEINDKGYVVAVPYAAERNTPDRFFERLQEYVAEKNAEKQLPVIMTAHLAVSGGDFKGHDNASELVVGGLDCQDLSVFGEGYDYVALGHIHRAQFIRGSEKRVRYSGTPIAISFDEVESGNEHSVSVVEIDKHGDLPRVRTIAIHNPHPLVNIPAEGFAEWDEVKSLFAEYPADIPSYIRLNVSVNSFLPPLANDEAVQISRDKQCRFCFINAKRNVIQQQGSEHRQFTTSEFQHLTPMQVAEFYLESKNIEFSDDLKEMFEEALKVLNETAED